MEHFITPFQSEIFFSDECKLSNHEEIQNLISNLYEKSPAKDRGNFYGTALTTYFYNDFTSHLDKLPEFAELKELILSKSKEYLINRIEHNAINGVISSEIYTKLETQGLELTTLWFNVNPYGGYQGRHHHAMNLLGGTYYLSTPENSGNISFSNPNPFAYYKNQTNYEEHLLMSDFVANTKEGDMLIWPGWMDHEISSNRNKHENRMTISWGVNWGKNA